MICKKCNQEIPENSELCANCGAAQNIADENTDTRENTVKEENSPAPEGFLEQPPAVYEECIPAEAPKEKKSKKKIIIFMVITVILAAVVAGIFFIVKNSAGKEEKKSLIYMKDETLYVADSDDFTLSYKIADIEFDDVYDEYSYYVAAMETNYAQVCDGKTFYIQDLRDDGEYSLYMKSTEKEEASVKIDSGITEFYAINSDGSRLVYSKDTTLYFNNHEEKIKLAKNVIGWCVDDELENVIYVVEGSTKDITVTVYSVEISADPQPVKISNEVTDILYISDDLSEMAYLKGDDIYRYSGGEAKKVIGNVETVFGISEDSNTFYFTKKNEDGVLKGDYFNDDNAESDKKITKPDKSDYQISSYYGYYTYTYTSDEYYTALENYEIKQNRDSVREMLDDAITTYDLYYYNGEEEKLVCEDIKELIEVYQNDKIVFTAHDSKKISKFKMSELEYAGDFDTKLLAARENTATTYYVCGGSVVDIEFKKADNFRIEDDVLYYLAECEVNEETEITNGNLTGVSLDKNGKAVETVIAEDVYYTYYCFDDGTIGYFKDVNDKGCGDFYVGEELVTYDVYVDAVNYKDGEFCLLKDYDSDSCSGTFCIGEAGDMVTVADDVNEIWLEDGEIFYTTNFDDDAGTYDIYCFDEDKSIAIAEEISSYTFSSRTGFMEYSREYMIASTGYNSWYYDCLFADN